MLNRNSTRMTAVLFFALAVLLTISGTAQTQGKAPRKQNAPSARQTGKPLAVAKVSQRRPTRTVSIYPLPNENLKTYKARMQEYFTSQVATRGLNELASEEGGEYNKYMRFLRYWEPRLHPHGDFKRYFELERTYYSRRGSRRVGVAPNQRRPDRVSGPGGAGTPATASNSDPGWEIGPIAKPTSNVGAEGIGPTEFITFYNPSPSHMLCGSNAGGLFYTTNGGVTWSPGGTDTQIGRSGVGTAVFHPNDHKTWFAASSGNSDGEPFWIRYIGGVFRTTDEGVTWSQIANASQVGGIWSTIFKLDINPSNANQLWAATSTGLFVTNNALAANPTWTAVPALSGKFLYDFEIRRGNASWLYATVADWTGSGPGNWSYQYSSNNGSTWQNVPGQAAATSSAFRLTIEVSPAKADYLYCLTIPSGGSPSKLYIYDFGLNQWNLVYGFVSIGPGGGHAFGVDPSDKNEIFLSHSTEGRRYNYQSNPLYINYNSSYSGGTYHPDIEDLIPHPLNANEVWMCNHGGVARSTDNGVTWQDRSTGIGVAQVIRMAASVSDPSYVALGLYHDGSIFTKASQWSPLWSPTWTEFPSSFCDGMRPMIDPTTPQYMWHSCQWGQWFRSTDYGLTFSSNGPYSPAWEVEAVFNNLDPKTQYRISTSTGGSHTVSRTSDRGNTWAQIANFQALYPASTHDYELWKVYTPETNGDYLLVHLMEKLKSAGPGANWNHHLYRTKIANAPVAASVIASWEELPLPLNMWMGDVDFDPSNPDIVYLANGSSTAFFSNPTGADMVFKMDYTNPAAHTNNVCASGLCWDITRNLPNALTGQDSLAVERGSNSGIYLATDFGIYYSNNATRALGGSGWRQVATGLPHIGYGGIGINYVNNKFRVGSFGRGVWEADLQTGCIEPPPGPALWLPFDETAGSTALNAGPILSAAGTHAGGPTPMQAGKVEGALCFDGQNDHVNVQSYAAINFATSNFSLDLWVLRNPGATGTEVLIDKRADTSPSPQLRGYSLFLINGQIGLQLADGTFANYLSQSTVLADGQWHHVAVTVNRGNSAGGIFYLDGQQAGPAFNPTGHTGSLNNSAPFRVGARSALSASGAVSAVLNGCLDEVQAFRRVLSPDEVLAIYRAGRNGKCKQGCSLPSVASFCGAANTITVSARICNYRSQPEVYNYSFQGLPAQSGCSIPGPVSFTPASGTVTVLPGQCKVVQTMISRPAGLTGNSVTGCYQLLVQVPATQETFSCGATVDTWTTCGPNPQ